MKLIIENICPECNEISIATFMTHKLAIMQIEPYHCPSCKWSQDCPHKENCPREKCLSFSFCSCVPEKQEVDPMIEEIKKLAAEAKLVGSD